MRIRLPLLSEEATVSVVVLALVTVSVLVPVVVMAVAMAWGGFEKAGRARRSHHHCRSLWGEIDRCRSLSDLRRVTKKAAAAVAVAVVDRWGPARATTNCCGGPERTVVTCRPRR